METYEDKLNEFVNNAPNMSSLDVAREMLELVKGGCSQKELAAKLSKSAPWVSRTLTTLKRGSPELLDAWENRTLPIDTIMNISMLPLDEQPAAIEEGNAPRRGGKITVVKQTNEMLNLSKDAPPDLRYVQGMRDMMRFMRGDIKSEEFADEWREYVDSIPS